MDFSLTISYSMHLVIPAHFVFFGWYVILVGYFPQKSLSENPKIGSLFSPPPNHTLSYLWPMAHLPCIGWVQVGDAWALCVLHSPCESIAFLAFMRLLLPTSLSGSATCFAACLTLCCVEESLGLHSLHFVSSLGWALLECELFLL